MLERKIFKVPKSSVKTFQGNGNGGVGGFIETSIKSKRVKPSVQRAWDANIKKFKKGKNFMWRGRLITAPVLSLEGITSQKITFIDKKGKKG